ncbi:MAG: aryl-sulfate sulfotransferase, partial [Bacteroidales bacterium]|nr:aryl-sulfate sulfotransferase [Bacteroidales bacterium]
FIIQELDADHNVIFQWRSWDHFEITDANHHDFTEAMVDYVHGNAFEIDYDDQLLFSCRDMEEITKIDRNSGEIIWRFGLHAQNNMFTFTNDTIGFSWQHDIRRLDNGNITVYDNGNYHVPKFSQAVEYQIDEVNFTATLAWNFIHDPVVFARATGANRRLDNGNSFICWGLTWPINYSEVRQDGHVAWELHWPNNVWEYRAFRLNWESDLFETNVDTIDFGEYEGYIPWPRVFVVTNNGEDSLTITSVSNHKSSYYVSTTLPVTIPPQGTTEMIVNLFPTQEGTINDVLTINCESMYADTLAQLFAQQIFLTGFVEDENPPEATFTPSDGTTDVPQDAVITINFDESIVKTDGSTINNSDIEELIIFKETDALGADVAYQASISMWKDQITILPDTLKPLQVYYVELKADVIADMNGNIVTDPQVSSFTTIEESGINETVYDIVNCYPNPFTETLTLEFKNQESKEVRVLNIDGKLVYFKDNINEQIYSIGLGDEPSGIYFIQIRSLKTNKTVELKTIKL